MDSRLNPPIWRHDAYTLRRLQAALERTVTTLRQAGVLSHADATVVDFGAGDVPYRPLFAPHCARYLACDLESAPGIDMLIDADGHVPLADGSASCVLSVQVLEHVWDVGDYLQECRRLLSADGRLVLSTHGTWLYHPHPGDYRRWTRDGLCRELEANGFEVLAVEPVVGPLAWTTQFRTLAYHHVLARFGIVGRALAAGICALMHLRMVAEDRLTPAPLRESNAAVYCVTARPRGT